MHLLLSSTPDDDVYTDATYGAPFDADLAAAKVSVLIQSAYYTPYGLDRWKFRLQEVIRRGVPVCMFVLVPEEWHRSYATDPVAAAKVVQAYATIEALRAMGVHVTIYSGIHEKVAVIDGNNLWDGSINFMSWNGTSERVTRIANPAKALAAVRLHKLDACLPCRGQQQHMPIGTDLIVNGKTIGRLITLRRRALGLTQSDLAALCATSRRTIENLENGKHQPRLDTLDEIFDALDRVLLSVPLEVASYLEELVRIWPRTIERKKERTAVEKFCSKS